MRLWLSDYGVITQQVSDLLEVGAKQPVALPHPTGHSMHVEHLPLVMQRLSLPTAPAPPLGSNPPF
jgi:hypothetical protein